jgi:AcrR family transcriptional regulator
MKTMNDSIIGRQRRFSRASAARARLQNLSRPHPGALPMNEPAQPVPRRRRSKAEQRELYASIVEASLRAFADGGYEALSIRKLAAEVGIAPMALYRYFPTKAHLIRHVWDDILGAAGERAAQRLAEERLPLKRLCAYLDEFLQYWLDHREHYWVVFCLRDERSELGVDEGAYLLRPNPQPFLGQVTALIDDCIGRARIDDGERRLLQETVVCKSLGYLAGVIGLRSLPWSDPAALKRRMIDDVARQVGEVCDGAPPAAPARTRQRTAA